MLLMGDEVRRTQHGNNNAYCQDNEISWFDWTQVERHPDMHRFVKTLVGRASCSGKSSASMAEHEPVLQRRRSTRTASG